MVNGSSMTGSSADLSRSVSTIVTVSRRHRLLNARSIPAPSSSFCRRHETRVLSATRRRLRSVTNRIEFETRGGGAEAHLQALSSGIQLATTEELEVIRSLIL